MNASLVETQNHVLELLLVLINDHFSAPDTNKLYGRHYRVFTLSYTERAKLYSCYSKGILHNFQSCKNTEKITVTTRLPVYILYNEPSSIKYASVFPEVINKRNILADIYVLNLYTLTV